MLKAGSKFIDSIGCEQEILAIQETNYLVKSLTNINPAYSLPISSTNENIKIGVWTVSYTPLKQKCSLCKR